MDQTLTSLKIFGISVMPKPLLLLDMEKYAEGMRPGLPAACDLVLGQLSPAAGILSQNYPHVYGSDELFRADAAHLAAKCTQTGEEISLHELLNHRVGTPATYSICLGYVLLAAGQDKVTLALTGPDADPASRPFVICCLQQIDLYARAMAEGYDPSHYRPDKTLPLRAR